MSYRKICFAIALSLFGVVALSKGANADVPRVVQNQLRDSCRAFTMYEVNYDGTRTFFDRYSGKNDVGTANWISTDINGDNNVNAVYEKRDFEISENNRTFFINTAVLPCFGGAEGSAVNVRIDAGRGNAGDFIVIPSDAYGVSGSGFYHLYRSSPGELKRSGQIIVTVKIGRASCRERV